jgi:hypothetical protein
MTDRAALVERVADIICEHCQCAMTCSGHAVEATAAIALIRAEVLEEAAQVVLEEREKDFPDFRTAVAAIRAMKGNT